MKTRKQMSRKAYKMTIGLFYLTSLILIGLLTVLLPAILWWIELKGAEDIYILLSPFYLASIITFLVWAFLRVAISLEPLTEEERSRPLLQRLSYLQLFACSGTAIIIIWTLGVNLIRSLISNTVLLCGWDSVWIFIFHLLTIAFAAALLYAGGCVKRIVITLLCFLLFIAAIIGNVAGTIAILNKYYAANEYCDGTYSDEDEYREMADDEDIPTGPVMEDDTDDDMAWADSAGISVIHYCKEYGKNTSSDTTYCFSTQLMMDFLHLQAEEPDEDYAAQNYPWRENTTWLDGDDCYYLYRLSTLILDRTGLSEDEIYKIVSERILPVILTELYDKNLYSSSPMESLVNMLDYAYYDLQSPGDEKLESLHSEMVAARPLPSLALLLPYVNRPYATVHSDFVYEDQLWAYSFWARRWKDGHAGLCRRLLDKVLETWPNTTYSVDHMEQREQSYRARRLKSNRTAEDVLQEIAEAFADAHRPEQQTILTDEMESDERAKMGETFSHHTWQEIPAEVLYENQNALSYFTPEGFRYYLPAFLSETVKNYQPGKQLYMQLLHALYYHNPESPLGWEYFEILSYQQKKAICHFLEWLGANHHADFTGADGKSPLWETVESWWIQYEE